MSKNEQPYQILGNRIRHFRKQWHQSLEEVSNSLEIDKSTLKNIEAGFMLPTEDILDMIINHFLLTDAQAEELRALATAHKPPRRSTPENLSGGMEEMLIKQIVMFMPVESKVMYTDGMNVSVNQNGVTLQFTQSNPSGKPVTISQVGMSREHALKAIEVLQRTLKEHDKRTRQTKLLPSPKKNKDSKNF